MILDIDIGNSRLKWRLSDNGLTVGRGACSHQELSAARDLGDLGLPAQSRMERIRVCSVANSETLKVIQKWAASRFSLPLEVAKVDEVPGGVRCGYRFPVKLGVDRWLAILAAWRELGETCVVVDAGTALTVDILAAGDIHVGGKTSDARGHVPSGVSGDVPNDVPGDAIHFSASHLGGYIVPGLKMMPASLYARADGIRPEPADLIDLADLAPGTDTGAAVQRGCVAMAAALVERVRAQAGSKAEVGAGAGVEARIPVVLTGGDAERLVQFIDEPVISVPDLVLDGLALALPETS